MTENIFFENYEKDIFWILKLTGNQFFSEGTLISHPGNPNEHVIVPMKISRGLGCMV